MSAAWEMRPAARDGEIDGSAKGLGEGAADGEKR
jgi:hypothetical protein